jgi:hypothetical protein
LGAIEGGELVAKAAEVIKAAEAAHARNEAAYEAARSKLVDQIERRAQTQAALQRAGDLNAALAMVSSYVPDAATNVAAKLEAGRQVLAARRMTLGNMGEALAIGREVQALQD